MISKPQIIGAARFSTSASTKLRLRNNIKVRPPIPPAAHEIKVPDDHPLWQFFKDKKVYRLERSLNTGVRPWTIPELRRKSFDDLHSLWYNCVKERNILAREVWYHKSEAAAQKIDAADDETGMAHSELLEKIRTTMWRIRHVLLERQHAFENTQKVFGEYKDKFLQQFESEYLRKDLLETEQDDLEAQLVRLNWAVFGVNVTLWESVERVDKNLVECVLFNAKLKAQKFAPEKADVIENVYDAFPVFIAEGAEVEKALDFARDRKNDAYHEVLKEVPVKQLERAIVETN